MKSGIRDKAKGTFHVVKGAAREIAGIVGDNSKLEVEGALEKTVGKVQSKVGQIKQVFGK